MSDKHPRVLIVAEHASYQLGGEAAIPLNYFVFLRKLGVEVRMVVHERTRSELEVVLGDDIHWVHFIQDNLWYKFLWLLSRPLPWRLALFTTQFALRVSLQLRQRHLIRQLVQHHDIQVVHQPIPVSPKEPSLFYGLGVPVIIGPMNGGMDYPEPFRHLQPAWVSILLKWGQRWSGWLNQLFPGKRAAAILLVANQRSRQALPPGLCPRVLELTENGVDLSLWLPKAIAYKRSRVHRFSSLAPRWERLRRVKFVFVGRLMSWKAVQYLIQACYEVNQQLAIELEIIGDGPELQRLQHQAERLGLWQPTTRLEQPLGSNRQYPDREGSKLENLKNLQNLKATSPDASGREPQSPEVESSEPLISDSPLSNVVNFTGWLSQADCAERLMTADVLVLPSLLEAGGAVILEAMAIGLPVIATKWGGPMDYVDDSCGILVEPTSSEGFVQGLTVAMLQLAQSQDLRLSMGRAGRERVLQYFDWEAKAEQMLKVYAQAIDVAAEECVPDLQTSSAINQVLS